MQRVMFVTNSLTGGGAERSMNLVSNELTKRGWPIALVPINASEADLVTPACEIFPLNRHWQGNIFNTSSAILKFNKVVKSWKPDVIVLNCDLPELFGVFLNRRLKIVVVEHSNLAWSQRVRLGKLVRKILSRRKAVWVAVSSHLRIWPDGHVPRAVLQNPLTPSTRATRADHASSILKRLVFLGRLSPEKRPELLLEIGDQSGFEVEIIGDGFLKKQLQDEATKRNLKVTFSGYVHNPWSHFQPGDLLIVPSASEGDGLVVIEGMELRIPMLLSDIADFRRFGFPDLNYCNEANEFVARANQYQTKLNLLIVPEDIRNMMLASRSLGHVGDMWEEFLCSVDG